MSSRQLDLYSSQIQDTYKALEDEIVSMFIKKLNGDVLDKKDFNIYRWHLSKLNELHILNNETIDIISSATGISQKLIKKMIIDGGYQIAESTSKDLSNSLNADDKGISSDVDDLLKSMLEQTNADMNNFVNQTLLTSNYGQGAVYDAYQSILNEMMGKVISGIKTPREALNSAIYNFIDKGLNSGFIDKAGRQWSLESYIRMLMDTTVYNVMNESRMREAHEYDVHTFLMSSHPKSRPACAFIQGHVVNDVPRNDAHFDGRFPTIYDYGYGEPAGTFGINCRHIKYPFIPGVNINNQPQYDPKEAIKNGELQQRQRQIERAIRNNKSKLNAATQLNDENGIFKYKNLIRNQQAALRDYLKKHSALNRDYSREKVYNKPISKAEKEEILKRSTINTQKNNRHIPGTYEYNEKVKVMGKRNRRPSYLTIDENEIINLVDQYGVKDLTTRTIAFDAKKIVGYFVDANGREYATSWLLVTYSKNGYHVTPIKPK
ncbi:phage minor capsid protein [Companilactobacillus sp. DQM5]|uniref:phage minor capsid protein n=1 Tax=Companilactobacillus sp. DQM5 TaxID=3463359 RepID=UPI00405A11E5